MASSDVPPMKGSHWTERRTFLWGMLIGLTNFFGMIFIISAFEYGVTSLVSAVVAINVLIILLYTRVFVKVKFSRLEVTGMAVSLIGILALRLL
ncbi:hypothetical protein D3C76_1560240 [compost metagenome]